MVPIYRKDAEKTAVLEATHRLKDELVEAGIRVKVDDRDNLSPGYKFNDWELRGVPVRLEVGPRDVEKHSAAVARRDKPGREGKTFLSQDGLTPQIALLLDDIHGEMLARATAFRDDNTHQVDNYNDFKDAVANGFARVWWAGSNEDEDRIKEETRATIRCFPIDQPGGTGRCFYTGQPADKVAIFARAY
jgi:prolyl-tRNA synthetase